MTTLQTSFELAPAGTAIPTTGVVGDGDAFNVGTNGTGGAVVSDATPGVVADGSFAALFTTGATATVVHRTWSGLTLTSAHMRAYIYLPAAPSAGLDFFTLVGVGIIRRLRIGTALTMNHVVAAAVSDTSTGTFPLNTLVRVEASFLISTTGTGSYSIDCYDGNSTAPMAGLSLAGSTVTDSVANATGCRFGCLANGPLNLSLYLDAIGLSDTGRLGPLTAPSVLPPADLAVVGVSPTAQDLTWTAATGALSYDIERDGVIIATGVTGTVYHDTGLTSGQAYSYRVRSVF